MKKMSESELLAQLKNCPATGTIWQHYKGGVYHIHGSAILESTQSLLVLYQRCYGRENGMAVVGGPIFARPVQEWYEQVELLELDKGTMYFQPRFSCLEK